MPLIQLKRHAYYLVLAVLIPLSGCTSLTLPADHVGVNTAGNAKRLQALQSWCLEGKLGLQSPHSNGSATLFWQQHSQRYQIRLVGPLGMGSIALQGNSQQVTLNDAKGRTLSAATPEALLAQIGWQLPVSNLYYWMRGLPIPLQPAQQSFNANGSLQKLVQEGWQIDYLDYQNVQGLWLPTKIHLQNLPFKAKIIIQKWDLEANHSSKI